MTQSPQPRGPTEAVADLQRYLSDAIAPMMAADSVARLMRHPAALTAEVIAAWMATQLRGPGASKLRANDIASMQVLKVTRKTSVSDIQ